VSRLARIKLDGGATWTAARKRKQGRTNSTLIGALLFGTTALIGAAWIGGSLFDTREAMTMGADGLASAAGLTAKIDVHGVDGRRRQEVMAVALPPGRRSIMAASPSTVKNNVESLDWVERAEVSRLWPSTIRIDVARRNALALWQEGTQVSVVDAAGERVHGVHTADYDWLPRVVGEGAGPAAGPVVTAIDELPEVRARLAAFVRIGGRRWDMQLKNGMVVILPEHGEVEALHRLEALQRTHHILDRNYARLDVRADGRLIVLPRNVPAPVVAGAPARGA
jgi:cell division protein FtsQ